MNLLKIILCSFIFFNKPLIPAAGGGGKISSEKKVSDHALELKQIIKKTRKTWEHFLTLDTPKTDPIIKDFYEKAKQINKLLEQAKKLTSDFNEKYDTEKSSRWIAEQTDALKVLQGKKTSAHYVASFEKSIDDFRAELEEAREVFSAKMQTLIDHANELISSFDKDFDTIHRAYSPPGASESSEETPRATSPDESIGSEDETSTSPASVIADPLIDKINSWIDEFEASKDAISTSSIRAKNCTEIRALAKDFLGKRSKKWFRDNEKTIVIYYKIRKHGDRYFCKQVRTNYDYKSPPHKHAGSLMANMEVFEADAEYPINDFRWGRSTKNHHIFIDSRSDYRKAFDLK